MHLAALKVLSERARIAQSVTIDADPVPTAQLEVARERDE